MSLRAIAGTAVPRSAVHMQLTTTLLLLAPAAVLFLAVFLWPVLDLLSRSVFDPEPTFEHYARIGASDLYASVFWRTVRISAIVTVATLFIGYPVAYAMARAKGLAVFLIGACVLVPLWSSVLVRSYAWTALLARRGIVNDALIDVGLIEQPLRLLYTDVAVVIAMTHVLLPFMILPLFTALRNVPEELTRAARSLGAREVRVFASVVLPLSMPGIYAGVTLTFLLAVGFFITPALVGGPQSLMVATLIVEELTSTSDWSFAAALSAALLGLALLAALLLRLVLAPGRADGHGN